MVFLLGYLHFGCSMACLMFCFTLMDAIFDTSKEGRRAAWFMLLLTPLLVVLWAPAMAYGVYHLVKARWEAHKAEKTKLRIVK